MNVLLGLHRQILQDLDKGFGTLMDADLVGRAEAFLWLWLLGAYEMVRTMCQAESCFSTQALNSLRELKVELSKVRMPSAKMEYAGKKGKPVTSYRSPAGIDAENKDLLIGPPEAPVSGRSLLAQFQTVLDSLKPQDVIRAHSDVE
ncbi:MAG: hypothetical protein ACLP5H_18810 [Desulfomonilaceae bacterium]